jgi:TolB-like protein/class 3 adenylate cyclase/Tfp pilus assembly protein PilF
VTSGSEERRLAAILSADVVGYGRLMEEDEPGTVARLEAHRSEIARLVEAHNGRVVDAPGDNVLAELASAVEATRCAVEIQHALRSRNADLAPEQRMQFRIGVHLGDVRVEGERLYGRGVNLAARLESLAEPGGICISAAVREEMRGHSGLVFDDLGPKGVKNLREPVRVYRVRVGNAGHAAPPARHTARRWQRRLGWAGGAVALVAAGLWLAWPQLAGFALWRLGLRSDALDLSLPEKPSIVVLPFTNMSGDPEQEYFADGITEDLTTDLSRNPRLFVISRNTAFTYRDEAVNVPEVGRELGVRYVMEGSVRRAGDRVRITAQLIDATSGFHVWSERYDRELADIFALQSELAEGIVVALQGEISDAELERIRRRPAADLNTYDLLLRGQYHYMRFTRLDNAEARRLLERAIELDPDLAAAYALLAATVIATYSGWGEPDPSLLQRAEDLSRRAIELDPGDAAGWGFLGLVHLYRDESNAAMAAYERAIALEPSFEWWHAFLAAALAQSGRYLEAVDPMRRALRLSPRPHPAMLTTEGYVNYAVGRRDQAAALWERARVASPELLAPRLGLLIYRGSEGSRDQAAEVADEIHHISPNITAAQALQLVGSFFDEAAVTDAIVYLDRAHAAPQRLELP